MSQILKWSGQPSEYSYLLQTSWFGVWTLVGARDFLFSTPVQNVLRAYISSFPMGTGALSWG